MAVVSVLVVKPVGVEYRKMVYRFVIIVFVDGVVVVVVVVVVVFVVVVAVVGGFVDGSARKCCLT